jgi:uncharacterized protein YjiK
MKVKFCNYALLCSFGFLLFNSCSNSNGENDSFPYKLSKPDEKYTLPEKLKEISGIIMNDNGNIFCVQDEKGNVYEYELKNEKTVRTIEFAGKGDFEGITRNGNTIFVLSSDGDIYQVNGVGTTRYSVDIHRTPLDARNDCEGLCYDPSSRKLLIACKAWSGIEKNFDQYKSVFAYDPYQKKFDTVPALTVNLEKLKQKLSAGDKFQSLSKEISSQWQGKDFFKPSDITMHPVTGNYFIISSVNNLLIETDKKGNILFAKGLPPDDFRQPEGICFDKQLTLFISDEGRSGKGNILMFRKKK